MPANLLALCKPVDRYIVKRIQTSRPVQDQLEGLFVQQEHEFRENITDEVLFDGGWKPDRNELLYAPITAEANAVLRAAERNIVSLPTLDAANFQAEKISALAVFFSENNRSRLLIQNFSAQQVLERSFNLIFDGNTFNRLTQPTFSVGTKLTAIVESGRIKFKLFNRVKLIFDLTDLYQEATDAEINNFCAHENILVNNVDAFKEISDQSMRKLVHAISEANILGRFTPMAISEAAASQGFEINVRDERIVFPQIKADAKALLHFLDNGLYRAALTGDLMLSNSKRVYRPAG